MELTPKQQTIDILKKSNDILIVVSESSRGGGVASGLALFNVLEKLGKKVVFAYSKNSKNPVSFLPGSEKIVENIPVSSDFVISLSLKKTKAEEIRYDILDDKLNFFITPSGGSFTEEDVSFPEAGLSSDLIVVLDSPDLENIGALFEKNTDLFYSKPVLNIDRHSSNDYFGSVNFVDMTASSTSEMMVSVIESLDPKLMNEDIATCLLAGIIVDTNSFQNKNTTPKSLTITAQLVAAGARHEEVVRKLFKTRPFDSLKIWGKILSSAQTDDEHGLLWSQINIDEEDYSNVNREVVDGVLDELLSTVNNINIYLLFVEKAGIIKGFIRTRPGIEAKKIAYLFGGEGRQDRAEFTVKEEDTKQAKKDIIFKISQYVEQNKPND